MAATMSIQASSTASLSGAVTKTSPLSSRQTLGASCPAPLFSKPSLSLAASSSAASQPLAPARESRFAVSAVASDASAAEASAKTANRYHFVVANAKFMLDEEEHFQEQLKERKRWLEEQGKPVDFWLLYEPKFLDSFPEITKRLSRPAVALVSTDSTWITFMKIRLDRVLMGEYECDTQKEALEAKPVDVEFDVPKNWIAPYTKYAKDWWKPYVPQAQ